MATYWLSFAPESGPGRVAIVDAESKKLANEKAHRLGLVLPGDESLIIEIPSHEPEWALPRNRILMPDELGAVDAESTDGLTDAEYALIKLREGLAR